MRGGEIVVGASPEDGTLVVWAADTGSVLHTFRDGHAGKSKVCFVGERFVVARHEKKPAVTVWEWGRELPLHTCYIAERLVAIAVDCSGTYLVGGGPSGAIHAWHIPTGAFLGSWKAHYRAVSSLMFVEGEFVAVSGGEDATIHAWNLADALQMGRGAGAPLKPFASWSEHTLPVTGLFSAIAGGARGAVVSCALDHSCKLWHLDRKVSDCTIRCPCPVTCCTMDALEQVVYLGGKDGRIFEKVLSADPGAMASKALGEAVGRTLIGHAGAVTSLACSGDGRNLISGSEDGVIHVWNRGSGERVRTFKRDAPVVHATVVPIPPHFRGENRGKHAGEANASPFKPFKKFKSNAPHCVEVHANAEDDARDDALAMFEREVPAFPCASILRMVEAKPGDVLAAFDAEDSEGNPRNCNGGEHVGEQSDGLESERLREELATVKRELEEKTEKLNELESNVLTLLRSDNANQ